MLLVTIGMERIAKQFPLLGSNLPARGVAIRIDRLRKQFHSLRSNLPARGVLAYETRAVSYYICVNMRVGCNRTCPKTSLCFHTHISAAKAPETPGSRSQDKRTSAPPCPTPPADEDPAPPSDGDATPVKYKYL